MPTNPTHQRSLRGVAWMTFCWSASSLMVFSLLPTFLKDVLHASHKELGMIEGVAIFLAEFSKIFAGVFSDYTKKRKPLIFIGSWGSFIVKPLFAIATGVGWVFIARAVDRISKGVRSSPTDALIADLSAQTERGRSYGLRQSFYTMGAVSGGLLATLGMHFTMDNYRLVFLAAMVPAFIALVILMLAIKAPIQKAPSGRTRWQVKHIKFLPPAFWVILGVVGVLMFARFSEAFVTLRAKELGWGIKWLPLMIVVMDLVHAAVAYPIGKLADRIGRYGLLLQGMLLLILANILLITATSPWGVTVGVIVVGLHMGITQPLLATLIADATPPDLRGTAFALYYLVVGIAVLLGNLIAGQLSHNFGLVGAFYSGLFFSTLSCLALGGVQLGPRRLRTPFKLR